MNWFAKPLASGRKGMPWESGDTEAACGLGGPELWRLGQPLTVATQLLFLAPGR